MLQRDGFAMQGRYTDPNSAAAAEETAADETVADETQWVARRLLARMHSYSRRSRHSCWIASPSSTA